MATALSVVRGFLDLSDEAFNRVLKQAETRAGSAAAKMNRAFSKMDKGFAKAGRGMGRGIAKLAKKFVGFNAVLGAVAGTAGIGLLIKRSIDAADAIGKTADRIGVSTAALQGYRFAADLSGVATQELQRALTALVRRQGEAINGNKEFAKGFQQVGISIDDLRRLKPEALILRVADGLNSIKEQAIKVAASDRVMSEAGRVVINVFRGGAAALQGYADQARRLGLIISDSLIRQAEAAKDKLSILGSVISTKVTVALLQLTPQIGNLADRMVEGLPTLIRYIDKFGQFIGLLEKSPAQQVRELEQEVGKLNETLGRGRGRKSPSILGASSERLEAATRELIAARRAASGLAGHFAVRRPAAQGGGEALPAQFSLKPQFKPLETAAELANLRAATQQLSAELDPAGAAIDDYRARYDLLTEALERGRISGARYQDLLASLNTSFAEGGTNAEAQADAQALIAERQGEVAAVVRDTETAQERFERRSRELGKLLQAGLPLDNYKRAMAELVEETNAATGANARLAQGIEFGLTEAINGNIRSFDDLGRVAVQAIQGIINEMIRAESTGQHLASVITSLFSSSSSSGGGNFFTDLLSIGTSIAGLSSGAGFGGSTPGQAGFSGNPHRQFGGPVQAGKSFLVGEAGPELFTPRLSGFVTPHDELGGGGVTVRQEIHIQTGVAQTVRAEMLGMLPQIRAEALNAVIDARTRGGPMAAAFAR